MTDKELIALVESKLPQELTLDEIELIRQRMRTSATVREALSAQLKLDQYLAGVIGKVELSAERVFAGGASGRRRTSVFAWMGWTVCLLLVGFVVAMLAWPMLAPPFGRDRDRDTAAAGGAFPKAGIEGAVAGSVTDQPADGSNGDPNQKPGPGEVAVQGAPRRTDPAVGPVGFNPNGQAAGAIKVTGNRIELAASASTHSKNCLVDRDSWGAKIEGNSGVLHSTGKKASVSYEFPATLGGMYRLDLKYAAAESCPVRLTINGVNVKEIAAAEVTGSWFADGQREFREGSFPLKAGLNKLRIEAKGQLPHLSRLTLTLDQPAVAVAPKNPILPWRTESQLGGPPRPMDEIAYDGFDSIVSPPSQDDAKRWFTPVQGNVSQRDYNGMRLPVLDGVNRFNPLMAEDSVLRLSFFENQWLTLHFWRGKTGLTLRMQPDKGTLVAYQVNRQANPNQPLRVLAGTDQDRNHRTNPSQMPARFDIRFHKGLLLISRGEVELMRVPYEGMPDEVIFDGHCLIRGLGLVRTSSEPLAEAAAKPIARDFARPAELVWNSELPKEIEMAKLPDGAIELKSQQSARPGWISFSLPDGGLGLRELIVEVDDVSPGSHIGLGKGRGEPKYTVGFFKDNNTGSLSFRPSNYGDASMDCGVDYNGARTSGYAAKHQWLKFIGGAGLKCSTSIDGVHWTPWLTPIDNVEAPLTHVSMWLAQGGQPRGMKLRRITLRKLETIDSLAGPELLAKAPTISPGDFNVWNNEVTRLQPPGTAKSAWRRACAIKTIAAGGNTDQVRRIIDQLLDEVMAAARPVDEQLARLDEFALLTNFAHDPNGATNFLERYAELAEQSWGEGNQRPWSTIVPTIAKSPVWCEPAYGVKLDRLQRAELLASIYAGKVRDTQRTLAALRLSNVQDPILNFAGDWLTRQGETDIAVERPRSRGARPHPLVEELNKEGFNLLGDFFAALESKAYRDACQLVTSTDTTDTLGLWPDPRDPQLLVSVNGAIDLAMKNDVDLRKTMLQEFGPLGMLQVKQAIGEADSPGVAAVVARFRGTEAAAMACVWLGDRAMSTGDFAKARGYYRQARGIGGSNSGASVAARDRLAAAMMGQDSGSPAQANVNMGDVQIGAKEFEALVAEMVRVHGGPGAAIGAAVPLSPILAPAPTGFELREIGRLDGELGDNPGDWNPTIPQHDQRTTFITPERDNTRFVVPDFRGEPMFRQLDWAARQIATAGDGDWLFVSNRFQVAAYSLKDGARKWQTGVGGEHAHTHDWSLTAMRPVVVGKRLYVRRLIRRDNDSAPELAALDKENGQVAWRTRPGLKVVSDPLWTPQGLVALTMSRADQQSNLYLSTFNPSDGVVVAQERLATLRETWWQQRTCQLSTAGGNLIAVFGGAVLCCDPSGKTRWVRRQEWIAPQEDPDWARQYQQPVIAWKDRLLVAQPGVACVECIDADSGALVWRKLIPGLRRMSGMVDDRLIVESQTGLMALSADKGQSLWRHLAGDLLDAQLCGGPGGILYARREKAPDSALRPVLVWLDPQTGRPRATFALEPLKHAFPVFGPFASGQNRLFAIAGGGENEAARSVYELVPKGAANMVRLPGNQATRSNAAASPNAVKLAVSSGN